ncbi:PH domain-containing protein [Halorussus halobius]|uniref:PH domain-containing protein n=1 Tax=Halorussus halobius TaxID=1710537 RepID=UPI0010918FDC|nr:PH domain-containing protein [Halorussus halobius]
MKLHPLSIPYRGLSRGASVGFMLYFASQSLSGTDLLPAPLDQPLLVALAGVAVVTLWQVAYFRRFEYELTDDGLDVASGVLSRRNREIPLGRIQNVDISRNVVQRALGVAAVDVETAGGGTTEASLRYVDYDEAKRLQREIQHRKRRVNGSADADRERADDGLDREGSGSEFGRADDRGEELFALDLDELVLLSVLSFDLRYLSLLAFGPAAFPVVPGFAEVAFVGGLVLVTVLLAGLWAVSAAVTFGRYYGFRLSRVGEELRYERGLLQRYDGSIPLEKVQTITLRENALMRRVGYATLAVETAGYAPGQTPSGGSEAAVPLATRERVVQLANELEPFDEPAFERPPVRARTRYAIRYALGLAVLSGLLFGSRALFGVPGSQWLALAPLAFVVLAPLAARLKWQNRGYAVGEDHVLTRNGFWTRTTKVVPYYRVQTVIESRTLFQRRRRWRLASVVIDTASSAGGAALAADLGREDAATLRELLGEKLQESLTEPRSGSASGSDFDSDSDSGPSGSPGSARRD